MHTFSVTFFFVTFSLSIALILETRPSLLPGAGVAGLASIGTARGMGAVVSAYDVRPVVREQVRQ